MGHETRNSILVGLAIVAGLVGTSGTASATFPGRNGRIAFSEAGNIFTMNSDGSDVRQITSLGPDSLLGCCQAWSPDGQQLVFPIFAPDFSSGQLWITNADGSNQHLFLDDPAYIDTFPTFSPDGSHVIFSHCLPTFQCGISRVRADGTDLTEILGVDPDPDVDDFDAACSPDGTTIAFTGLTSGGLADVVYLMNADGSNIRSLTPPALGAVKPDWSPNGSKIAFSTGFLYSDHPPCLPNSAIWLIDPDDGDTTQLTGSARYVDLAPSWSPQGDAITFERDTPSGQTSIYVMRTSQNGGAPVLIHQGFSPNRLGSPAPDPASPRNRPRPRQLRAIQHGGTSPRWGPAN